MQVMTEPARAEFNCLAVTEAIIHEVHPTS